MQDKWRNEIKKHQYRNKPKCRGVGFESVEINNPALTSAFKSEMLNTKNNISEIKYNG